MKTNKKTRKVVTTKTKKSLYTSKKRSSRFFGRRNLTIAVLGVMVIFGGIGMALSLIRANAAVCTVNDNLVNSCRPWLGATVGHYPGVGSSAYDLKNQVIDHERRIGRQLDVVHSYLGSSDTSLSSTDKYFINRANTLMYVTWKPSGSWAAAGGGNATVNANIDKMADSVKSIGSKKIFFSVFHEPENDIKGTMTGCSKTYTGGAGTAAEYRAMWRNVYNRFNARGVTNAVWTINFMGFSDYNCMIDDLWPGNDIIDWIMWDPYSVKATWEQMINPFYSFLTTNSNATTNYTSKAWGLAEWGSWKETTRESTYRLYDGGRAALAANTFPRLKAYIVFDYGPVTRVSYDKDSAYDATEMAKYKQFAQDPHFTNAYYGGSTPSPAPAPSPAPSPAPAPAPTPAKDTTVPTVNLTTPSNGATLSGTVAMAGTASDASGIKTISFVLDDNWIASDTSAPFSINLDTNKYAVGAHSLRLRAWDNAGNYKDSSTISVTFKKSGISGGSNPVIAPTNPSNPSQPIVVTPATIRSLPSNKTIPLSGVLRIAPAASNTPTTVTLDGETVADGTIDSTQLTDGEHVIEVTENGKTKQITVAVDNPFPLQVLNEVRAHPVAYAGGAGISLATLGAFFLRGPIAFMFRRL